MERQSDALDAATGAAAMTETKHEHFQENA